MNDPTPIGSALDTLDQPATEIVTAANGTRAAIQWQGTAVTGEWITAYVESLILARLVEQWQPRTGTAEQQEKVRHANRDRLMLWHQALAGLPREGLEAAREYFVRQGPRTERWFLRPSDVSSWVRARAARKIPVGKECGKHPDQWAHDCRKCSTPLPPEEARARIAQIRQTLAQRKDTP